MVVLERNHASVEAAVKGLGPGGSPLAGTGLCTWSDNVLNGEKYIKAKSMGSHKGRNG